MPKNDNSLKNPISEKIKQLEANTEWFYSDEFMIDYALEKYQETIKLAKEIEQQLTAMKNQVEVIADFSKNA